MKKFMPKLLIALATLVGGTYVLQTVQPFAEKTVEAAGDEKSIYLGEGDVFTYGTYNPVVTQSDPSKAVPLKWRIVYANAKTKEAVAMTEQPIEQASKGWNTNCYYAGTPAGSGNCTDAPWSYNTTVAAVEAQKNRSIIDNQEITGSNWINAYFGGSVADWMDRYFVPNFVGSIQDSTVGTYIGYYNGDNKDQWNELTTKVPVQVDWFNTVEINGKSTEVRALASSNGSQLSTKNTLRGPANVDSTGMYNPYIYTMPFAYTTDGTAIDKNGNSAIDENELTTDGYPINAELVDSPLAGHKLPQGEKYDTYYYPSTWISYYEIISAHRILYKWNSTTSFSEYADNSFKTLIQESYFFSTPYKTTATLYKNKTANAAHFNSKITYYNSTHTGIIQRPALIYIVR